MKYSDSVKAILLAAIDELAKNLTKKFLGVALYGVIIKRVGFLAYLLKKSKLKKG